MRHIQRDSLLQSLQEVNNTPDIKIISGVRRSGKSQLLMDYDYQGIVIKDLAHWLRE